MFSKKGSASCLHHGNKKAGIDAALRKSDRRKLRTVAAIQFPHVEAEILSEVFIQGDLFVRKLHHDDFRKVYLYLRGPSPSTDSSWPYTRTTECIWITVDADCPKAIECPSVALMSVLYSQESTSYPTVIIPSPAARHIVRGANVMRPGMMRILNTDQDNTSSTNVVAVCVPNNSQPFAVGQLQNPSSEFGPGTTGVGVLVFQSYGDDLYKTTTGTPIDKDAQASPTMNLLGGAPYDNGHYGNLGFVDAESVVQLQTITSEPSTSLDENNASVLANNASATSSPAPDEVAPPLTTDDHDALLHEAACSALVNINQKAQLPMQASTFYGSHVLAHKSQPIDLSRTSFKKFSKYMTHHANRGLWTLGVDKKDPSNNVAGMLVSYDRKHEDLQGIEKSNHLSQGNGESQIKRTIVSLYIIPKHFITNLDIPKESAMGSNAKSTERKGTGMLTLAEARTILETYSTDNELISKEDHGMILLDDSLTKCLYGSGKKQKQQQHQRYLARKDAMKLWFDHLDPAWALVEMPGSKIVRLARGKPPTVTMAVNKVGGNKLTTRLRGIEEYDIDARAFCVEVSKRFACSGTIESQNPMLGKLKKDHVEILFQGHLVEELKALLLGDERLSSHGGAKNSEYRIPKQCIEVVLKKGVPAKKRK